MTSAVAELERLLRYQQSRNKLIPEWAPRPVLPAELRARINFAAIDRLQVAGYTRVAQLLDELKAALVASLTDAVRGSDTPLDLGAALTEWATTPPPAVRRAVQQSRDRLAEALVDVAGAAAAQVRGEAAAQGIAVPTLLAARLPGLGIGTSTFVDDAATPVAALLGRVQATVLDSSQRPAGAAAVLAGTANTSTAGPVDLGRQAVHIAHGEGRAAQIEEVPAEVAEVYASELLDGRTCKPCLAVDGLRFTDLEDAYQHYPSAGPYRSCSGGARCRGTLVVIWSSEAAATVQNLPPQPPRPPEPAPPSMPAPPPVVLQPMLPTPPATPRGARAVPPDVLDWNARELKAATDDDLAAAVGRAFEVDHPNTDRLIAEMDRREAAPLLAEQKRELNRAGTAAWRAKKAEAQNREISGLIDGGMEPREAVAQVTGVSVEKQLRTELRVRLEAEGVPGRNLEEMVRVRYKDEVARLYVEAEDATNGYMVTRQGAAKGIDPLALFTGSEARARRWASDELKEWWDLNGRLTLEDYRHGLLTGQAGTGSPIADFLA